MKNPQNAADTSKSTCIFFKLLMYKSTGICILLKIITLKNKIFLNLNNAEIANIKAILRQKF